jgi:transposase
LLSESLENGAGSGTVHASTSPRVALLGGSGT